MTLCVLDASAALAMTLADERRAEDQQLLHDIGIGGAVVPALWHLEIANVLMMIVRRKRIDRAQQLRSLSELGHLSLAVDPLTSTNAWTSIMELAEAFDLTVYDASYLELAMRTNLPLATRDKALRPAAPALAVPLR